MRLWMPAYPDPAPPVERTGAGDAFASTFVAALALGREVVTALLWAPVNCMSVVGGRRPGGLLRPAELVEWLDRAPAWYHPQRWPGPVARRPPEPAAASLGIPPRDTVHEEPAVLETGD